MHARSELHELVGPLKSNWMRTFFITWTVLLVLLGPLDGTLMAAALP